MIQLTDRHGQPLSEREIEEQIKEQRRERRMLIIRNWLNSAFILLAVIAMVGIVYFKKDEPGYYYSYGVAVVGVIIKMIEALFRMPGFGRKL